MKLRALYQSPAYHEANLIAEGIFIDASTHQQNTDLDDREERENVTKVAP